MTRGLATLLGVAAAGALIWLATWMRDEERGEYWAAVGLYAAAGLVLALSQLLGGWTKWGMPRTSPEVLVLGFLPALVVGGWVIGAHEPAGWFSDHLGDWAGDAGVEDIVADLGEAVPALAVGIGLAFGFTFDTSGRRAAAGEAPVERDVRPEPPVVPERADDPDAGPVPHSQG